MTTLFVCFLTLNNLQSQICPDCDNLPEATIHPRFWEDPDGILYQVESIDHPDKLGIWIIYEDLGSNQRRVLHTNHVRCLDNLDGGQVDGRSKLEITSKAIQVFPNPTSEDLTIVHPFSKCNITLSDLSGRTIFNVSILEENTFKIKTSSFPSGVYTLSIVADEERFHKKIIIK
jgi:hypothetical protein